MTIQELAKQYSVQFTRAKRDNGDEFVKVKDDAPDKEALRSLCMAGHDEGGLLPDDWRYEFIEAAIDALSEVEDADEAREHIEADIYTSDLTRWLHSAAYRVGYITDALEQGGGGDRGGFLLLHGAQFCEKQEVFDQVRRHMEATVERG